ncbi:hypothetical protein GCM10023116_48470 [Kistimonas scapharcae]|uniref:Uncharacterized protein n=1 Tax=Kistimonas scapharcae TaxID=1036133 RepID=A0ABP8V8H7_9GAMM
MPVTTGRTDILVLWSNDSRLANDAGPSPCLVPEAGLVFRTVELFNPVPGKDALEGVDTTLHVFCHCFVAE